MDMNRSRLELAVLLFPDFNENFTVERISDSRALAYTEIQAAQREIPEAMGTLRAADTK